MTTGLRVRGTVPVTDPSAGPVDLVVAEGAIVSLDPVPGADLAGLWLAPGFVDLQCNGGIGIDLVAAPERLWELAADLPRHGVTSFLPTLVSCPDAVVERAQQVLDGGPPPGWVGARPLGLHLEGPLVAVPGAHRPEETGRTPARTSGVALVTLAPELPGALELVADLAASGIVVAMGHTAASTAEALAAVDAGVRAVTHLFNAMPTMHHRQPGPVGVALADERLAATLVVDLLHAHPMAVAAAWRALGPHRAALVTDAGAARGMPPGTYSLGGVAVESDGLAVRNGAGALAGSALAMDQAVRNLVAATGCSLGDAVVAASVTPAAVLGRSATLEVGAAADFVLLDEKGRVAVTVVGGEVVHDRDHRFG